MSTRNALNSGIIVFASPTLGVSWLQLSPVAAHPWPKCHIMPTISTILPLIFRGWTRLVTRA